jgi:hypothetical protein
MARARSSSPVGLELPNVASTVVNQCSRETMTIEKRRLNSRAPISRLPLEVLSFIFSNVQEDHVAALAGTEGFCLPFADVGSELWIGFTQVCHHWREVALGTPTLWTRVASSPSNHKWTQEMLLRSKRCLLTCIIEDSLGSCDSASRFELVKQLGRCHTLSMREFLVTTCKSIGPRKWTPRSWNA